MRKRPRRHITHSQYKQNTNPMIKIPKKDHMSLVTVLAIFIYFIGTIILITVFPQLVINITQVIKLFCLFLAVSFLIPINIYRKKLHMSYYEYIFVNFLGVAPILLLLTFGLNHSIKSAPYTETYKIVNSTSEYGTMTYLLENNEYEEYSNVRTIEISEDITIEGSTYLSIQFSDGLFGIRIIENRRVH